MKETYSHEFNAWQRLIQKAIGMWRINRDSIDFKWGYFAPVFGLTLLLHRGGYFDPRFAITICLIWGKVHIHLPVKTKLEPGCDMPRYGIDVHGQTFWLHMGGKYNGDWGQVVDERWLTWRLPFVSRDVSANEVLHQDGKFYTRRGVFEDEDPAVHKYVFPYRYIKESGEVQKVNATCEIHRITIRRKWLPILKTVHHDLQVKFDGEVGEGAGSWKGGVIGTGERMEKGETAEQCLRRMERDRVFAR